MDSKESSISSTKDENGPSLPHDQSSQRKQRRATVDSEASEAVEHAGDQSHTTGSLNLSGICSLNYGTSNDEDDHNSSDYEDQKAIIMSYLMQNHAAALTESLVERTMLIQSIIWLSHHVPECVLRLLFESIILRRDTENGMLNNGSNAHVELTAESHLMAAMNITTVKEHSHVDDCGKPNESLQPLNDTNQQRSIHMLLQNEEESTPISKNHDSALLFVDMSGFTKISTILDLESLSNAINLYFQLIVDEVTNYGGDILKFAGDAIFAEWKASCTMPDQNINSCVMRAAECAASIVASCSDYPIHSKPVGVSRASIRLENTRQSLISRGGLRSSLRSSMQSSGECSNLRGSVQSADEAYVRRDSTALDCRDEDREFPRRCSTGGACHSRRSSVAPKPAKLATLNVKCGIGVGRIVGVHVGDDVTRREYLILGDPIDQVTAAENAATSGQVWASPEALNVLSGVAKIRSGFEEAIKQKKPFCIAERQQQFYDPSEELSNEFLASNVRDNILNRCDDLGDSELRWFKQNLSLYVHPVVVNDDESRSQVTLKQESELDRHLSQAELRNVFAMFISPQIDYKLSGDKEKDEELFRLLNNIMNLISRHLKRAGGHLRQFIADDKGVVIICTFGLRGSTFPNMISQRGLPLARSIHDTLQEELGVGSKIGATFGRAYCGVVGGLKRHEFAVLGPSVNLAARLMGSTNNPCILVDKSIRLLTSHSQIFFKPLPAVSAKGYDEPVAIFEPVKTNELHQWDKLKPNFVGRSKEIKQIMQIAKDMALNRDVSKLLFVSAASGTGKSSMMAQTTARIRSMVKKMNKSIILTRHISNDGDSRVPFSLFRSIFKELLNEMRHAEDEIRTHSSNQGENNFEISVEDVWDNLSLNSQSTKDSVLSTDANRFRFMCEELNAPPDFVEVVGRRLLGIRDKNIHNDEVTSGTPNLDKIVEFLSNAFIRCTDHTDLTLLALDDVHELDEMSWKVVQTIYERGSVLILCGSRPPDTNPLAIDSSFWSDLHNVYSKSGRYVVYELQPLIESDIRTFIASSLEVEPNKISGSFSRNLALVTGGLPHFLSYAIDAIKRGSLVNRLDDGQIGLKSAVGIENKIGFGSVSELLLYRLDSLNSSVRNALHIGAVLGTTFELVDAALVFDEMYDVMDREKSKAAHGLQEAFHVAVEEGILEESFSPSGNEDEEEIEDPIEAQTSLCASLGNITFSLRGYRKTHPAYSENRVYRFTHDSWKTSVINVMLNERVQEIHEHAAIVLEREIRLEAQREIDFEKEIRVFHHWNSSGHFANASELALKIGGQLMMLGLNSQSILLFDDAMGSLKHMSMEPSGESHGGIPTSILSAIEASELENLTKLNIAKGKAFSTLGRAEMGAEALQNALDILKYAPSANDEHFDRSVSFPIFSGLFVVLKMGAIHDDNECSYEKSLIRNFVEQARLNGDPVHYGRALAMESETLGRLGLFEQALETFERIRVIHDINTQHAAICQAYGSDRVAQAYSHSVNWNSMLQRTDEAVETIQYILDELAPKSNIKNIHNSFCLLFSSIIFMKENGDSDKASNVFKTFVVAPFDEHFAGGSTFSKPLFYPLLTLLDLQGHQNQPVEKIDEYFEWALDEGIFSICPPSFDQAWAAIAVSPSTLLGEICHYLSERSACPTQRCKLINNGLKLMETSIEVTKKLPYANMYANKKLNMLRNQDKKLHNA